MIVVTKRLILSGYLYKKDNHGLYKHFKFSRPTSGKKGQKLLTSLCQKQSCVLNRISKNQKEKIGGCRFVNNKSITKQLLMKSRQKR